MTTLALQEGLPSSPGPAGGPPNLFRPSGRASQLFPALRVGLPTTTGPP